MASTQAKTKSNGTRRVNAVPPVESSTNTAAIGPSRSKAAPRGGKTSGDLTVTLNRKQWTNIVGALSLAAADLAGKRNFEQMFEYNGLCGLIGQRLGAVQQTAAGGDLPPPQLTRAAGA